MKWLLLLLLFLLIAGALAAVVNTVGDTRFFLRLRRPSWDRQRPRPRCLQCRGTGWVDREPERTLNFVGDGFEDRHAPARMCPACGGTGEAPQR
ncbi:hypothetical protein ACQP2F_45490 [Actinoplanes sp. CA-030573]|uniref:hypothetical protein n=1 Tax=Actinoplanes sp. CA-030573 TaxID=3239898 RepID=UPI003D909A30